MNGWWENVPLILLHFKVEIEKGMEKSIDEMDCFIGALLDMTIQQTIKCEFMICLKII